jgi:hypothetical protein
MVCIAGGRWWTLVEMDGCILELMLSDEQKAPESLIPTQKRV